jgi:hypothetical protein
MGGCESVTISLSRHMPSLLLLEWGAIMLYFGLSGRASAFLHPNFRPLLWLAGTLLVLTAVIVAIVSESKCCDKVETGSDDSHHPGSDADHVAEASNGQSEKGRLTLTGVARVLVLCLPIALASMISPDSYGETFLENRGIVSTFQRPAGTSSTAESTTASEDIDGSDANDSVLERSTVCCVAGGGTGASRVRRAGRK